MQFNRFHWLNHYGISDKVLNQCIMFGALFSFTFLYFGTIFSTAIHVSIL